MLGVLSGWRWKMPVCLTPSFFSFSLSLSQKVQTAFFCPSPFLSHPPPPTHVLLPPAMTQSSVLFAGALVWQLRKRKSFHYCLAYLFWKEKRENPPTKRSVYKMIMLQSQNQNIEKWGEKVFRYTYRVC